MGIFENRDAQFMLLAGFIIAIGLVITTVMLNSVIFEGNMAVGAGADPSKSDVVNLMKITKDETRAMYWNVTQGNASNDSRIIASFTNQTQSFRDNLSIIYALNGEGMNLSWNVSNWNSNNYAYFTDNGMAGGATNWTVIQNVSSSRIKINVTGSAFQIGLINSSVSWINLTTTGNFTITNSTSTDPYSIVFRNGGTTTGNYSINGTASGRAFTRARDYILYTDISFSTSRLRADITIPVSVPW